MIAGQINGIYDISYFDSSGNEYNNNRTQLWWSSKNRYSLESGSSTSEYIEIDLTKRRLLNYISFDVMQKPIDIEIQYDCVDLTDIDQYSHVPRWKSVQMIENTLFDSSISYQSDYTNPWKHCEFYFNDQNGEPLIARRLRIKFTRRDEDWPTVGMQAFVWTIDVKNLRVARFVNDIKNALGDLIEVPSYSDVLAFPYEVRQRFSILDSFVIYANQTTDLTNIDGFIPSSISPKIFGFEVLINPNSVGTIVIDWNILDITNIESVIAKGIKTQTVEIERGLEYQPTGGELAEGITGAMESIPAMKWVRILFDKPIDTVMGNKYEIRLKNANPRVFSDFYSVSPNPNKQNLVSEDFDLHTVDIAGKVTHKQDTSMVYRILADVGHAGKDLLGNGYREGVRYNSAPNANDGKLYTNWTCFPNPSQDGVEALYFDVRKLVNGLYLPSVIDALDINTLTPGIKMNVYYSKQSMLNNASPQNIKDWENMMWTPVRDSFKINQKQTLDLPYPICANWVCLEFYNLQAIPMGLPNYPILPEVEYKEFPDWVYTNNPTPTPTSDEPFLQQEKFVEFKIADVVAPSLENNKGLRIYAVPPQTLNQNIDQNGFGSADPQLLSKVSFSKNPYAQPTINTINTETLLGDFVYNDYTSDPKKTYIAEAKQYPRLINSRNVSNINDRRDASRYDEIHALFNRICAHQYVVKKARYNKKGFIVSISEVNFFRKDYAVEGDDPVIHDVLVYESAEQSLLIESSSWETEQKISMPIGKPIFVTYTAGGVAYTDETVYFEQETNDLPSYSPVGLVGSGSIATSTIARSNAFGEGETYYRDQDFAIVYDPESKKNYIKRDDNPARLVTPHSVNSLDKYTVFGSAIIVTEIEEDMAELGKPSGTPLTAGSSAVEATMTPPVTASSSSGSTAFGSLTDPTD